MNTTRTASKSEAIALIKSAKKAGWEATTEGLRLGSERPFAVTVRLCREYQKGALYVWARVFVTFRLARAGRRASVSLSSFTDFSKQHAHGLWSARYAIAYVNKCYGTFSAQN